MSKILPIVFNTEMTKAILDGRKTVTRRIIKLPHCGYFEYEPPRVVPQYQVGDTLYVRETVWQKASGTLGMDGETETALWNEFKYVATDEKPQTGWNYSWIKRPSIHMPKEAARIWLKVTAVRAERLQDITENQARAEGVFSTTTPNIPGVGSTYIQGFGELWNNTLKKDSSDTWAHNPWVWVYEFERCEKLEEVTARIKEV